MPFVVDFLDIVVELLDTEHTAVVGQSDTRLTVSYGFIDQFLDAGLTIEYGILAVYVQMDESGHSC